MWERMIGEGLTRFRRLETKEVNNPEDIKAFFNACSHDYARKHGHSERLLSYRIGIIKDTVRPDVHHVVLDVGCGIGHYLLHLAKDIGRGIGIDFSEPMIATAIESTEDSPWREKLDFRVDNAEQLSTVSESDIDIVMCVGAIEHMRKKRTILASAYRVLKPGGQIILLTPNGRYLWYRLIAPALRLDTKHLSTDSFLGSQEIGQLLRIAGFINVSIGYWTFIPKGDMHPFIGRILSILDGIGSLFQASSLRGGLLATARKG
jgi:ubiquinone/menaquinone biosynthesis C-methylase UbiE